MNFRAFSACLRGLFDRCHNYATLNASMQYLLVLCMYYWYMRFPNLSWKGMPLEEQIVMDLFLCFTNFEYAFSQNFTM